MCRNVGDLRNPLHPRIVKAGGERFRVCEAGLYEVPCGLGFGV